MTDRLSPQPGEWIDRDRTVGFRFEGRDYTGFAGDTLSSALWANGVRVLGRSFKYHRPRGIYSLANHDVGVMVDDAPGRRPRRTNLRGDVLPIEDGLDVVAVNTKGGVDRDRWRITERFKAFMPVGFYYKAFYSPRFLYPLYEREMRKVAGLGKIDTTQTAISTPKRYDFCDVLVVGAGPSGLSAGIAAAQAGAKVIVVDENPHPGGSLNYQGAGDQTRHCRSDLIQQAESFDNLEIRTATLAAGCYGDLWVALIDDQKLTKLRAKSLVVAGGVYEQLAVFRNNDVPGVMLASAAQRLIHQYAVRPCRRAVVVTANDHGYRAALDLHGAGVEVAALADLRHGSVAHDLVQPIHDAGIPVHAGHAVLEAHARDSAVNGATLCAIDESGEARPDHRVRIDCDGVAVSVGWMPAGGLLYQAGARFKYDNGVEQLVPDTLPSGVFAAGRAAGVFDLDARLSNGRRAGQAAAAHVGLGDAPEPAPLPGPRPAQSHPYPIFAHPQKQNCVDFDEDLHLSDFKNAHQEGYDNIELLKRYTTVGMGPSQGKLSNMNAVRILARLNNRSVQETGTTTSRPFQHPVLMAHLAGRRFHSMRHTPLHEWHRAHNAEFMFAGTWYRPEYYRGHADTREQAILDEAQHVRSAVGLIDVSTLGKIDVCGPDAGAFLERIYTGRFTQQTVGRVRYGLACDESGVIIEDGIIARMADDQYYVTATSSGAAAFYREMQRWAIIWGMDVTLINLTGHLGAMNIAGPDSRRVLQTLTDSDLSRDAFGYLGFAVVDVAGVPARLMRVGFVGELGYEVHVPASQAQHVWSRLMEADASVTPFGVEAQRLLRLEKGHLIVSQDTDALTTPAEASTAWAINADKPFFIGQRSLAVVDQHPQTRRLVGLTFPAPSAKALPLENHLMIEGGRMIGRITSVAHRTTLGYPIAMGFVPPDRAAPQTSIQVRVGKHMANAVVTPMPFYDPDGERQNS